MLGAEGYRGAAHGQLVGWHGQGQVREPAGQLGQRDAQLDPGQRLADALVDAEAEGHVLLRATLDIEGIRLAEDARVVVRRGQQRDGSLAGPDRLAADLDVGAGDSAPKWMIVR